MIYTNHNNVLNEKTLESAQLSVAFEKLRKLLKNQKMDTKKIDKMIKEIEACNKKIEQRRKNPDEFNNRVAHRDRLYIQKVLKECLYISPIVLLLGIAATIVMPPLGALVAAIITVVGGNIISSDEFFNKLENENNQALNYLKKEKELIEKRNTATNKKSNSFKGLSDEQLDEVCNKLQKELINICKSYNNDNIYPEVFETYPTEIIFEIMHMDQDEILDMNHENDTIYSIGGDLENSNIFKELCKEYDISIEYGDGDEGCLYIKIFIPINESTKLYGQDADEFLESMDICLYDDCLSIGEYVFNGINGNAILNENGIFLYEECIILEGQQAEEYKARKAKEIKDTKKIEMDRKERRYGYKIQRSSNGKRFYTYDQSMTGNTGSNSSSDKERSHDVKDKMDIYENMRRFEAERSSNSNTEYGKNAKKSYANFMKNKPEAADALNRRYRRHPETNRAKALRNAVDQYNKSQNNKSIDTSKGYDNATKYDDNYDYPIKSGSVTVKNNKPVVNRNHYYEQSIFKSVKFI